MKDVDKRNVRVLRTGSGVEAAGARLISGDFVVGRRVPGGLTRVMAVTIMPAPDQSRINIGIVPFHLPIFTPVNTDVEVKDEHILVEYSITKEMEDNYIKATTGIIV